MQRALSLLLVLPLSACMTSAAYERSALRHEANARQASQLGDGWTAARESELAVSDRESLRLHVEKRTGYWHSEVFMR